MGRDLELKLSDIDQKNVEALWEEVFNVANRILLQNKRYGFEGMGMKPKPSVKERVAQLKLIGAMIDALLNFDLPHNEIRLILNAKQQITLMEGLAFAIDANDRDQYDRAIIALEKQAPF